MTKYDTLKRQKLKVELLGQIIEEFMHKTVADKLFFLYQSLEI